MRRQASAFLLALAGLIYLGCDKAPQATNLPSQQPPPPQTAAQRPTTQSLLKGPWKRISLVQLPLSVEVPESWKLTSLGTAHMLEGPTSRGEMRILLSQRPRITASQLDFILQGANREKQAKPDVIKMVELRNADNMKILERQSLGSRPPATDTFGNPLADTSPVLNWTITAYIPQDSESFKSCELSFLVLTLHQYQSDETLLRRVVDSLRYEP